MASKPSRTTIPGMESLRRCLVGQTSGPASCPSASRLVETVCTQLCRLIPSSTCVDGTRRSRWASILLLYQHIRDLVLGHQRLMAQAPIQLFELNCRTLSKWFIRTQREKGGTVLAPGVAAEGRPPAGTGAAAANRPPAGAVRTGQATAVVTLGAAAPSVAAPVLPAPLRLLAPLPPAPSAATGPFSSAQPLLLDLSLPQQSVRALPILPALPRTTPAPHVLPLPLAAAQHAGPPLPPAP